MEGILVSPRFDAQIRKRRALYKKRNESPKFRDILRERCHARIRASRCALIEKFRSLRDSDELHSTLSDLLKNEVRTLLCAKGFYDEIDVLEETEDFDEDEEQWLLAEYEKILAEEEANLSCDWEREVICPLCEKCVLSFNEKPVCLRCSVEFPAVNSLSEFKAKLDAALTSHAQTCEQYPHFAVLDDPHLSGLFLICESCQNFSQVLSYLP